MANHEEHLDKTNYDDVYLRNVILGFVGFLRNRFSWTNTSAEHGAYKVEMPIHYSLTGDSRYVMDSFYDDMPDKRVNMNTDSIPRGVVTLKSWAIKPDEFTNPNIWLNVNEEIDDELIQIAKQTKAIPLKLTFSLDTIFDNEIDIFKAWQTYMNNMWIYKYFTFTYNRIPINGVFNFVGDTSNDITRDFSFETREVYKSTYEFEVHTFYPMFDAEYGIDLNDQVRFITNIWQTGQNTNLPSGSSNS